MGSLSDLKGFLNASPLQQSKHYKALESKIALLDTYNTDTKATNSDSNIRMNNNVSSSLNNSVNASSSSPKTQHSLAPVSITQTTPKISAASKSPLIVKEDNSSSDSSTDTPRGWSSCLPSRAHHVNGSHTKSHSRGASHPNSRPPEMDSEFSGTEKTFSPSKTNPGFPPTSSHPPSVSARSGTSLLPASAAASLGSHSGSALQSHPSTSNLHSCVDLFEAAKTNRVGAAKELIRVKGLGINGVDKNGWTGFLKNKIFFF
jgi:hypothetical protein